MIDADSTPVHFAYPFERGPDGDLNMVEQDTPEHVMAQVNTVVRYPVGYLAEEPDFGIPWPDFRQAPIDARAIADAVVAQVPDAADVSVTEFADAAGAAYRTVELDIAS